MRIGVLGTGDVGKRLATKMVAQGNEVKIGSRTSKNPKALAWAKANGRNASAGSFKEAAEFGQIVFNCTPGAVSLAALKAAGADNLEGKVLVDVSNPLDFSKGMPPTLTVCNTDSVGEEIQRAFPKSKVVKAFNTMSNEIMTDPKAVKGQHDIFLCGNDAKAKAAVVKIMKSFGWASPIDLGDITGSRGMEMILPLWVRLMMTLNIRKFNFKVVR